MLHTVSRESFGERDAATQSFVEYRSEQLPFGWHASWTQSAAHSANTNENDNIESTVLPSRAAMYAQESSNTQANPFSAAAESALWTLSGRQANSSARLANASPAELPQNIFTTPAVQPSSVINLSNSTDVVIGPMTQYQGPVTIYQYMDATVEARSMQAGGGINNSRHSSNTQVKQRLSRRNSLLLLTLILLVVVTAAIVLYVELGRRDAAAGSAGGGNKPIYFGNSYDHDTFPNLGNGHLVIDRVQWGASDLARQLTVPLRHPIPYVLITHIGVQSIPCVNVYKCSIKMRTIQDSAIAEKNLPDIQSNFYVSDEGNVYVGRGWDWANTYANNTLAITFMGDYGRYKPSVKQLEGVQFLLAHAVANKQLDVAYNLVSQNQTKSTKSPGVNVYREIRAWPHFYVCGTPETPQCGSELGMTPESWDSKM